MHSQATVTSRLLERAQFDAVLAFFAAVFWIGVCGGRRDHKRDLPLYANATGRSSQPYPRIRPQLINPPAYAVSTISADEDWLG